MIKRIIQKIKTRKIGKNAIIFYLPDEKKSRLRAFARTRAKKRWIYNINPPFDLVSNLNKNPSLQNHFSATLQITSKAGCRLKD